MEIIPAIDIIEGKCVRLTEGDYSQKKIYNEHPLEVGKQFDVAVPISTRTLWWDNVLDRTDAWWLRVMGRLKSGVNLVQAAEYVKALSASKRYQRDVY